MSPVRDTLYDVFTGPDTDVIAKHMLTSGKKAKKKNIPEKARLTNAITGVSITDTIMGSSTLTITLVDPDYDLIDSEFFDTNKDGRLDALDIEYPDNSGMWWRVTQVAVSDNSGGAQITLTAMERGAAHLASHRGPLKVARGKRTRAEFLKMCSEKVKAGGGIDFHCRELHKQQQIGSGSASGVDSDEILYVGDSLARGTNPNLNSITGKTAGWSLVGASSAKVLQQLRRMMKPKYSYVVFDAGTNDGDVSTLENNLRAARAAVGAARMVIFTVNKPGAGPYNDVIMDVAGDYQNVVLCNWHGFCQDENITLSDGIHPTAQGYKRRAKLLAKEFGPVTKAAAPGTKNRKKAKKKPKKESGIAKGESLTVKGIKATDKQIAIAEEGLSVAADLNAPDLACLALLVAFIQESTMSNLDGGDRDSVGVLQVRLSTSGSRAKSKSVEWCAETFLTKGFWKYGGAIKNAKQNPSKNAGQIAQETQGSAYPSAYQPHIEEAKAFLEAYGGGGMTGGGSTGATRKYNFEIGTSDNPNEDLWAGMNRLAEEVKWPLFLNGQDLFYDHELTLIKQRPALVLERGAASLITYEVNWDTRQIATEMTLDLVCEPDEFRAGQVFKLNGFGPASRSSTAIPPLPGRWLISEIERDMTNLYSSFTLKQPEKPLKEPKGEQTNAKGGQDTGSSTDAGPLRDRIIEIAKKSVKPYFYSQNGATTTKVHPGQGNRSDCSQWARACYMTAGAPDPGTYTGAMLARGKTTSRPKPGDLLCSPTHVELFIGDGKTIGHGSDPIDYDTVAGVKGRDSAMRFITYDFLDK